MGRRADISLTNMAPSWILQSRLVLILVLLYGNAAQETPTPPDAVDKPPANSALVNAQINDTDTNSTHTETASVTTTVHTTKTMANHTSTMDILSIMSQRDSFQEESDRLRVAVIILGVLFTLAAVAIIIGLVWFFVIRRRSGTLKGENQGRDRTAAEQKKETLPNKLPKTQANDDSANRNAQQKTDKTAQQQGKGPSNATASTFEDYEDQSDSANKAPQKAPRVDPKKNKAWYANTSTDLPQPADNPDRDEREVYIELDDGKPNTDTSAGEMPTQPGSSQQHASPDEIYENYTPETREDYSQLDTETQYDHNYD